MNINKNAVCRGMDISPGQIQTCEIGSRFKYATPTGEVTLEIVDFQAIGKNEVFDQFGNKIYQEPLFKIVRGKTFSDKEKTGFRLPYLDYEFLKFI